MYLSAASTKSLKKNQPIVTHLEKTVFVSDVIKNFGEGDK